MIASVSLNMTEIFDNWFSHHSWQFDCIIKSARCHFTLFFYYSFFVLFWYSLLSPRLAMNSHVYIAKIGLNSWSFCFCLPSVVIIHRYCHIHLVFFFHFFYQHRKYRFYGLFLCSLWWFSLTMLSHPFLLLLLPPLNALVFPVSLTFFLSRPLFSFLWAHVNAHI